MRNNKEKFDEFSRRLDNVIDAQRTNLSFVQKHKPGNCMSPEFYAGALYACKLIKSVTKELRIQ